MRAAAPPGVSDLAARLRSTLAFFASRPNAAPLSQVFVTGAGAAVEGVHAGARRPRSTRRCSVVTVADVIAVSGPPPAGEVGLNLVGTVGIALGEVR